MLNYPHPPSPNPSKTITAPKLISRVAKAGFRYRPRRITVLSSDRTLIAPRDRDAGSGLPLRWQPIIGQLPGPCGGIWPTGNNRGSGRATQGSHLPVMTRALTQGQSNPCSWPLMVPPGPAAPMPSVKPGTAERGASHQYGSRLRFCSQLEAPQIARGTNHGSRSGVPRRREPDPTTITGRPARPSGQRPTAIQILRTWLACRPF